MEDANGKVLQSLRQEKEEVLKLRAEKKKARAKETAMQTKFETAQKANHAKIKELEKKAGAMDAHVNALEEEKKSNRTKIKELEALNWKQVL